MAEIDIVQKLLDDPVGVLQLVVLSVQLVVLSVATTIALRTYIHSKRTDRIGILLDLHKRFMEHSGFAETRIGLEGRDPQLVSLIKYAQENPNAPRASADGHRLGQFDDYLGFFELLAHLEKNAKFRLQDIDGLFGYFVGRLWDIPEVEGYVRTSEFGFGHLQELIEAIRKKRP